MVVMIAAVSARTAHRIQELGLLIGALAGLVIVISSFLGRQRVKYGAGARDTALTERTLMGVGGLLLLIAFLVTLAGLHRL